MGGSANARSSVAAAPHAFPPAHLDKTTRPNAQYFWHKRELTAADEGKSLLELNMHTGFQLKGYDLVGTAQWKCTPAC